MELDNYDAMTDIGIGYAYGTFGLSQIPEEAVDYLSKAASEGNVRACMELVELHDTGSFGIEGAEALKWCEKAAKAGDKKAIARLEDGFDTRPLPDTAHRSAQHLLAHSPQIQATTVPSAHRGLSLFRIRQESKALK